MATVAIPKKPTVKQETTAKNTVLAEPKVSKFNNSMAFSKENYMIMLGGIALLIIGFTIMSLDKDEFGFGFLGLTLGPIVVMLGFVTQFFALLRKPKVS